MAGLPRSACPAVLIPRPADRASNLITGVLEERALLQVGPPRRSQARGDGQPARKAALVALKEIRMIWLHSLIAKPLIRNPRASAHLIEHRLPVANASPLTKEDGLMDTRVTGFP